MCEMFAVWCSFVEAFGALVESFVFLKDAALSTKLRHAPRTK